MKRSLCLCLGVALAGVCNVLVLRGQSNIPVQLPVVSAPAPVVAPAMPTAPTPLDSFLTFDALSKESTIAAGEVEAKFAFNLTNISSGEVTILYLQTSCGCTAAKLPTQPWILPAGSNGQISVSMNLQGKTGTTIKTVTVHSDKGAKTLLVKGTVTPAANTMGDRAQNQALALADRQAVFKGDCASCHVEPAKGKHGKELFAAACGICHEAEHRASMVPDLHALSTPTDAVYWRNWITHGKPGTLMPAFAQSEGGFLTDAQITSLVSYLTTSFPAAPQTAKAPAAAH